MATKIFKNNRIGVLRQFMSIYCQFKDKVVVEICCSYLLCMVACCYSLPLFYNVLRNGLMNLSPYGRNVTLFELSIVLRSLSVLWHWVLLRCASTTLQSATRLEQNTATRLKLWAIGYRILAMGYWLWVGVCDCTINYLLALRAEIL